MLSAYWQMTRGNGIHPAAGIKKLAVFSLNWQVDKRTGPLVENLSIRNKVINLRER